MKSVYNNDVSTMPLDKVDSIKKQNQFHEVMKRLLKNKTALVGLSVLCIIVIACILAPVLAPYGYNDMVGDSFETPSWKHLFGTDKMGRDLFSRILYGGMYSLGLAIASQAFAVVMAIILGCISGYYGNKVDLIIMRIMDVFQAIPGLLLAICISAALGEGFFNTLLALGISKIATDTRVVRASVLKVRGQEFLEAAVAGNCSVVRQILKYVLPNSVAPLIVNSSMGVGGTLIFMSSLSYIGLGVQPPTPEWGAMLVAGKDYFRAYPHLLLFPGLFIGLTILSLNLLGDGLRDAMDPKLKK